MKGMRMPTQKDTLEALQILVGCGVPALLWGDPGTGKTETIEKLACDAGAHVETVIASLHDPTDFGGLPVLTDGGVMFEPPAWARRVADHDGPSVVFFDEVNTAAPSTQNALMKVVLSGMVGQFSLGDDVTFVAAANPPEQNPGAWDLSLPLANRFAHLDWPLSFEEYRDGVHEGFPVPSPVKVDDGDTAKASWWRAMQLGYLARRSEALCSPPADDSEGSRGWPSPRSWDRAVTVLAAAESVGHSRDSDVMLLLAEALLGAGTAVEFVAFARDADLPDPEALLADPESFRLPERVDQQYAALESVRAAVAAKTTKARWEAAVRVCIAAGQQGAPDTAAAILRGFLRIRPANALLEHSGMMIFSDLFAAAVMDPDNDDGLGS